MPKHLLPGQRLDLREAILCVFRIHGEDLFAWGRPQYFDDFNELVDATFPGENRLSKHQLSYNAPNGPDVDVGAVVWVAKDELRGAVVAWADVGDVGLAAHQLLGTAEVAKFQNVRRCVH